MHRCTVALRSARVQASRMCTLSRARLVCRYGQCRPSPSTLCHLSPLHTRTYIHELGCTLSRLAPHSLSLSVSPYRTISILVWPVHPSLHLSVRSRVLRSHRRPTAARAPAAAIVSSASYLSGRLTILSLVNESGWRVFTRSLCRNIDGESRFLVGECWSVPDSSDRPLGPVGTHR